MDEDLQRIRKIVYLTFWINDVRFGELQLLMFVTQAERKLELKELSDKNQV